MAATLDQQLDSDMDAADKRKPQMPIRPLIRALLACLLYATATSSFAQYVAAFECKCVVADECLGASEYFVSGNGKAVRISVVNGKNSERRESVRITETEYVIAHADQHWDGDRVLSYELTRVSRLNGRATRRNVTLLNREESVPWSQIEALPHDERVSLIEERVEHFWSQLPETARNANPEAAARTESRRFELVQVCARTEAKNL